MKHKTNKKKKNKNEKTSLKVIYFPIELRGEEIKTFRSTFFKKD